MNVLFIEQHPRFIGGSERISLTLCGYLRKRGHNTQLLYEIEGDMVEAYLPVTHRQHRAPVRPLAVRHPVEAFTSLRRLGAILREQRIDVIFTSQLGYVSLLAVARSIYRVPSVLHLGLCLNFPSPLFRWGRRKIEMSVTPSEPMRQSLLDAGWPAARLRVVPNGVDRERFHPPANQMELRASLGLPGDRPIIAYVGRLVEEKGIFTLVQAAAVLRERGMKFHLILVGSAPQGQFEALASLAAKLGLDRDNFSLRTATNRPESIYAAADAVVVPSEWAEPFGLAAIEAMACGAVTIVSDAGILPQIVGPGLASCVFAQGHVGELAQRLTFVLTDRAAQASLRAAGLARVEAHYDLAQFGAAYEQVLEKSRLAQ
jgi:glycosyltransferase involved in cell wall biosynthesis